MLNIIKNVLKTMEKVLNSEQLQLLGDTLRKEFMRQEEKQKESNEKLLNDFIASKSYEDCSPGTLFQYRRENEKFLESIHKKIENINKKDIERYLSEYKNTHEISNTTLNNMRRYISAFFTYLEFEDVIKCNPVRKIKPVKEIKTIKKPFSELEIEELRDNVSTMRDKAIIDTLNTTGMRVSELCSVNIDDIHDRAAVIRGKGNKERKVYFSERSWHNVQKYLESRNDDNPALFVNLKMMNNRYKRISKSSVEKMIRKAGRSVDVIAHPHKFRRTVASRAANKGMPIQEIQVLLGHSKIDTTMIYCNVNEANVRLSHERYVG